MSLIRTIRAEAGRILRDGMQFARYIMSGLIAAGVDLVLLFLLAHTMHVWYLAAATVAFVCTVVVSFVMQKFWTFRDYSTRIPFQVGWYLVLSLCNIGINTTLMYFFVDILGVYYIAAQVYANGIIALYGFFIYRNVIFKGTGAQPTLVE